ncbi:MAG TPA: hypothetical protein VER96_13715 [Polyangiaceae bacterium]|nr:hypothetical protein [Polyangiaceae bacterium]
MFATTPSAPVAPNAQPAAQSEPVHLLLVSTPSLTPRGRVWLERAQLAAFDGLELQRLIRLEKLSLG